MTYDKARNFLGICVRAGQVTLGSDAVMRALEKGRADLILLDEGASDNSRKRMEDRARAKGVQVYFLPELGQAVGRESIRVASVQGEMAGRLAALCKQAADDMYSPVD